MWHELVLHGIGGRTIAEAQRRLSYAEVMQWQAYRMKYGSLNVAMRLELEVGQLRAAVAHALGSKESVYTFLPHVPRPETKPQTFEEICAVLMSVAPRKQKDAV